MGKKVVLLKKMESSLQTGFKCSFRHNWGSILTFFVASLLLNNHACMENEGNILFNNVNLK